MHFWTQVMLKNLQNLSQAANNVNILINLDSSLQLIIITHKPNIFAISESLVGIVKSPKSNFSEVYSLNL